MRVRIPLRAPRGPRQGRGPSTCPCSSAGQSTCFRNKRSPVRIRLRARGSFHHDRWLSGESSCLTSSGSQVRILPGQRRPRSVRTGAAVKPRRPAGRRPMVSVVSSVARRVVIPEEGVRIPSFTPYASWALAGPVGCKPSSLNGTCRFDSCLAYSKPSWSNGTGHRPSKPAGAGSNPAGGAIQIFHAQGTVFSTGGGRLGRAPGGEHGDSPIRRRTSEQADPPSPPDDRIGQVIHRLPGPQGVPVVLGKLGSSRERRPSR